MARLPGMPAALKGSVSKRPRDGMGWLVSERWEVSSVKRGDPAVRVGEAAGSQSPRSSGEAP